MLEQINSQKDIKKLNIDELNILSKDIREFLIEKVSKTGGHLASNLGVVELTLAMHYVFDSPKDKFIFDVGHQSYVHKILTGRKEQFDTLRQFDGLSGFPKRKESEHDIFETGHSSTSISAGLGIAKARDVKNEDFNVLSLIGDGALTGGMALEALNHLGHDKTKMIVLLNDNEMSISKNVGGMSNYLSSLRVTKTYKKLKEEVEHIFNMIPKIGKNMYKTATKVKGSVKNFVFENNMFEDMGINYIGPIDGHDLKSLIYILDKVKKNIDGPVLIHVITKKGKGYKFSEDRPEKYHGVSKFNTKEGLKSSNKETYSSVVGKTLCDLAKVDKDIVAITAAMPDGCGLCNFKEEFKERFFDVGIAEGHGVTFCAGLATNGLKPYFPVYSTFLQRGFDQILHDVGIQNLPVKFLLDRAGLVGNDGETHHGVFDLSYLSMIPNMCVMSPMDKFDLINMLRLSKDLNGPCSIRYPRGVIFEYKKENRTFEFGKWEVLKEGKQIVLLGLGKGAIKALNIGIKLKQFGIDAMIINARFLKPHDQDLLKYITNNSNLIYTIEDNVIIGGFGSYIGMKLEELNYTGKLKAFGIDDEFIEHGDVGLLEKSINLDEDSILKYILDEIEEVREVI